MRTKVTTYLEEERIHNAIVKLQRFWRNKSKAMISWGILRKIFTSVRMIQRNYRSSKWLRLLGQMARNRRKVSAEMIQSFCRGWRVRKTIMIELKRIHLGTNFLFFEKMREKLQTEAKVVILYHWRKS